MAFSSSHASRLSSGIYGWSEYGYRRNWSSMRGELASEAGEVQRPSSSDPSATMVADPEPLLYETPIIHQLVRISHSDSQPALIQF